MIFILSQLQLPGQGCLRLKYSAEPCREPVDEGQVNCAINRDGAADEASGRLTIEKHFYVEGSTKTKENRNRTDEMKTRLLETNTTVVAQLVESSVHKLINARNDPEGKGHKKEGKKKRLRSMMRHSGMDKEIIAMHKHTVTKLLEEYNVNCGDESVQNVTYCESILVLLEEEMRSPKDDRHRKARHLLEPSFLCWNIVPFRIKWYNPMTQICCNGIHDRISGDEICCGNEVVNETGTLGCCGMEAYNTVTSLCCGDRIYNKSNASIQCCGSTTYDSSTGLSCCNNHVYDSARQFCCNNNVLYDNIGRRDNHGSCCGSDRYDSRCYSCNVTSRISTIYPIFKPETQVCCEGRIKTTRQNKTECCGKRLIDPRLFHCVNGSSQSAQRVSVPYDVTPTFVAAGAIDTVVSMVKTFDTVEANFEETDSKENDSVQERPLSLLQIILISLAGVVVAIAAIITSIMTCRKRYTKHSREVPESASSADMLLKPLKTTIPTLQERIIPEEAPEPFQEPIILSTTKLIPDTSFWGKNSDGDLKNLTSELSSDAETQTFETKRNNVRDTFGNIYQHSCYLDRFNRKLTWDRSDCKMTLPESAVVNHNVEAYASSFDSLPSIYEKFSLPPETRLVSPVVEYRLPGMKKLDDFALVELPFFGKPDYIEVWKCPSDEGMYQTTECLNVPILEKADMNSDLWCLIENGKVRVYTKSFSVFFCTCRGQQRSLYLRAFLFGSYKKILKRKEVQLSLYIADELHKFTDYNQRMYELETLAERELKCDKEISLHKELNTRDYLDISMSMVENGQAVWDHKLHPTKGIELEDKYKRVNLEEIARCCNFQRSLPKQVGWHLENKQNSYPKDTVQCVVDINCCLADERSPPINTHLCVDELQLRAKDRENVPSEEDRAADLKDFLNHHLDEGGKTRLNEELKRRIKLRRHSGECQDLSKSLDCLYNDMYPGAFTRTVALILDGMPLDNVIDQLVERKLISKAHLKRPLQACAEKIQKHTIQGFENCRLSTEHQMAAGGHSQNLREQELHIPKCRRELGETIITSYDDRNLNQKEREDLYVPYESEENPTEYSLLEAPQEDSEDEPDTELKQIVTSL